MTNEELLNAYDSARRQHFIARTGGGFDIEPFAQAEADARAAVLARMESDWLPLDGAPDEIRDGRQILVCQGQEQAVVRFMRSIEDGDGQWIIWRQLAAHNADGFAIRMPAPTHYKLLGPAPDPAP